MRWVFPFLFLLFLLGKGPNGFPLSFCPFPFLPSGLCSMFLQAFETSSILVAISIFWLLWCIVGLLMSYWVSHSSSGFFLSPFPWQSFWEGTSSFWRYYLRGSRLLCLREPSLSFCWFLRPCIWDTLVADGFIGLFDPGIWVLLNCYWNPRFLVFKCICTLLAIPELQHLWVGWIFSLVLDHESCSVLSLYMVSLFPEGLWCVWSYLFVALRKFYSIWETLSWWALLIWTNVLNFAFVAAGILNGLRHLGWCSCRVFHTFGFFWSCFPLAWHLCLWFYSGWPFPMVSNQCSC